MTDNEKLRLDVFLHRARFFKTREGAAAAIETRGVRLESAGALRKVHKTSQLIGIGDRLSLHTPRGAMAFEVLALPVRRGPPEEARGCYRDLLAPANEP